MCERTHLDRRPDAAVHFRRPGESRVKVVGVDHVKAAKVFPGLGERAVGYQDLAVGDAHHRCTLRPMAPRSSSRIGNATIDSRIWRVGSSGRDLRSRAWPGRYALGRLSRTDLSSLRSRLVDRRICADMSGAARFEKPDGSPRLRSVMCVRPVDVSRQV